MNLFDTFWTRLLDSRAESVGYECRDCRTPLDDEDTSRPHCGVGTVARHDLS